MKIKLVFFLFLLGCTVKGFTQQGKTKNVILVSLDGYRWRELFLGADSSLLFNKKYTKDSAWTVQKYWAGTTKERREKLMPFTWSHIAKNGQLYGNRTLGNKVDLKNTYWFSFTFPGGAVASRSADRSCRVESWPSFGDAIAYRFFGEASAPERSLFS